VKTVKSQQPLQLLPRLYQANRARFTARFVVSIFLLLMTVPGAYAQRGDTPLQWFGYYQNAFQYNAHKGARDTNSFLTQQLNIIIQKDLALRFRSFVNFEFLNTFESSLGWGSASLKEAWVRYDSGPRFRLKLGLQIPIFNHLNEIKTRTPLLPYIVRPIVYETSLEEIIQIEDYVPEQAFVQAYGQIPHRNLDFSYALFLGNSPNVNNDSQLGQTGVDTTATILVGGRLGLRWNNQDAGLSEVRVGLSSTFDRVNFFRGVSELVTDDPTELTELERRFEELPRWRFGGDLAVFWRRFYLQSEFISVVHGENSSNLDVDKYFYYATLGYFLSERTEVYGSYWRTDEFGKVRNIVGRPLFALDQRVKLNVYTLGGKYNITPRVVCKFQWAIADLNNRETLNTRLDGIVDERINRIKDRFSVYSIALSVFF
jgi:hypothetical protein